MQLCIAVESYLKQYEKEHGEIPVEPENPVDAGRCPANGRRAGPRPHGVSGCGDKRADDIRPYRVGSYPPVARGTPALRRHGTDGGPAGQVGTARQLSGLAGWSMRAAQGAAAPVTKPKNGTGRGCTPGSCFVCTAFRRHEPPYWGVQGGRSPPALLSPLFLREEMGAPAAQAPAGRLASTRRADTIRPYGLGSWRTALVRPAPWQTAGRPGGRPLRQSRQPHVGAAALGGPPPGDAPVSGQKSAPPGIRAALVFTALRGNTPNQGWQAAACRGCCAGR